MSPDTVVAAASSPAQIKAFKDHRGAVQTRKRRSQPFPNSGYPGQSLGCIRPRWMCYSASRTYAPTANPIHQETGNLANNSNCELPGPARGRSSRVHRPRQTMTKRDPTIREQLAAPQPHPQYDPHLVRQAEPNGNNRVVRLLPANQGHLSAGGCANTL